MQRTRLIEDVGTKRRARGRYKGGGAYKVQHGKQAVEIVSQQVATQDSKFQITNPDVPKRMISSKKSHHKNDFSERCAQWWHSNRRHALTAVSLVAVLMSGFVAFQSHGANQELRQQLAVLGAQAEGADTGGGEDSSFTPSIPTNPIPDETEVTIDEIENYYVAPTKARYISIPKFDSKARVKEVGVTETNNVDTPENIFDTAWYNQSSSISDTEGIMFVVGHVTGPLRDGIFYNLKKLNTGDIVSIEQGDGTIKNFEVLTKEAYHVDSVDMDKALHGVDDLPGLQLNLMTCSGAFDAENLSYDHRLLVTTREVL